MKPIVTVGRAGIASSLLLFLVGCSGMQTESPTLKLFRGELPPHSYREAVTQANEQQRADEAFERNREPTRAYNTRTGRFEYLPEDTRQEWNPETERWEFTPEENEK